MGNRGKEATDAQTARIVGGVFFLVFLVVAAAVSFGKPRPDPFIALVAVLLAVIFGLFALGVARLVLLRRAVRPSANQPVDAPPTVETPRQQVIIEVSAAAVYQPPSAPKPPPAAPVPTSLPPPIPVVPQLQLEAAPPPSGGTSSPGVAALLEDSEALPELFYVPPQSLDLGDTSLLDRYPTRLPRQVTASTATHSGFFGGIVAHGRFQVRGAGLPGKSHLDRGEPGQDALGACWADHRGALCIAVADGVGSKRNSEEASRRAVLGVFRGFAAGHPLDQSVEYARQFVVDYNSKRGLHSATTLVVAELTPGHERTRLRLAAVGDSEAWLLYNGVWEPIWQERSDDERTAGLPGDPATIQDLWVHTGAVLVLATDGFAKALGDGRTRLAVELSRRWAEPPTELHFTNDVSFRDKFRVDDRAVVAVWV